MKSLNEVFNKFAGKEVQVNESTVQTNWGPIFETDISPKDTIVAEFRKAIEGLGLTLRLWLPGWGGTCDYRTDRVNVGVSKGTDGKYRIGSSFDIG